MKRAHHLQAMTMALVLTLIEGCGPATPPPLLNTPSPTATSGPTPTPPPLPYETPDWFKEAVLYQVFVRSFYDANGDGIGDLKGVTAKLDYIQSLGANTLWLNPIHPTTTYHGYDVTDYYAINPDFGAKQDLIDLVEAAHARGMKVIWDYVANHMSDKNPIFLEAYAQPQSQYADWFLWKDDKHVSYQSFFGNTYLPQINQGNPAARAYFIDNAKYWMDLDGDGDYTDGLDGLRADYALGPVQSFWKALRAAVKPLNPNFLLLGEVWVAGAAQQVPYLKDEFDALFDFPLYAALMNKPEQADDNVFAGKGFISAPIDKDRESRRVFGAEGIRVTFLSNHDTDRLATELENAPERLALVPLFLATFDGTPAIYYGEELGQKGHKGGGPIYDEYRREPMDWRAAAEGAGQTHWFKPPKYTLPNDGISVEEQDADPSSLLNTYRHAMALRLANPALKHGQYAQLPTDPKAGVWAFWRYTDGQIVLVIFNFSRAAQTFNLDMTSAPGTLAAQPKDLLTGAALTFDPSAVPMPPGTALVLDWTP
jgi:glycosidase